MSSLMGISCDTLRYYEKIGLLPHVAHADNGLRDYNDTNIEWLHYIIKLKSAGISLDAILEYIQLAEQGDMTIQARKDVLKRQRLEIVKKIALLNESLEIIDSKINQYHEKVLPVTQQLMKKFHNKA